MVCQVLEVDSTAGTELQNAGAVADQFAKAVDVAAPIEPGRGLDVGLDLNLGFELRSRSDGDPVARRG